MIRRLLHSLVLGVALAGCSHPLAPTRAVAEAQQLWQRTRPTNYRFTLAVGCFCGFVGPVVIEVHGDSVVGRRVQATGDVLDPRFGTSYTTIDGLFTVINQAYADHADHVDVRFDPTRGYPTSIAIDREERAADDEVGYAVTGFEALPP